MGARVIIGCRDQKKGEEAVQHIRKAALVAAEERVVFVPLDLTSFRSIRAFAAEVDKLCGPRGLDILVNNAGMGVPPAFGLKTADGLDLVTGTNHFGPFLLTSLLLAAVLRAKGRVVNVSSGMHHFLPANIRVEQMLNQHDPKVYRRGKAYSMSKLANVMHAYELQKRYGGRGLRAYSVAPGIVATDIFRHATKAFQLLMNVQNGLFFKTCAQGAQPTLYCCLSAHAVPGRFHADCAEHTASKSAYNDEKCKDLWEGSVKNVGLTAADFP
jgi:dehydrogenase/reductase SDR family protein 13